MQEPVESESIKLLQIDLNVAQGLFDRMKELGTAVLAESDSTVWFSNSVICILDASLTEYNHLTIGVQKSPSLLAFACRNLLELNICTKFIFSSAKNAKDFVDDQVIDGIELFQSFRRWMKFVSPTEDTPLLDQTLRDIKNAKMTLGITRTRFIPVRKMAQDVNFQEEYEHGNKITSKLIHPTALSIFTFQDKKQLAALKPLLFNHGVRYFCEIFNEMENYINKNGLHPKP